MKNIIQKRQENTRRGVPTLRTPVLSEGFSLTPSDKNPGESKKLSTDGKSLDSVGMGDKISLKDPGDDLTEAKGKPVTTKQFNDAKRELKVLEKVIGKTWVSVSKVIPGEIEPLIKQALKAAWDSVHTAFKAMDTPKPFGESSDALDEASTVKAHQDYHIKELTRQGSKLSYTVEVAKATDTSATINLHRDDQMKELKGIFDDLEIKVKLNKRDFAPVTVEVPLLKPISDSLREGYKFTLDEDGPQGYPLDEGVTYVPSRVMLMFTSKEGQSGVGIKLPMTVNLRQAERLLDFWADTAPGRDQGYDKVFFQLVIDGKVTSKPSYGDHRVDLTRGKSPGIPEWVKKKARELGESSEGPPTSPEAPSEDPDVLLSEASKGKLVTIEGEVLKITPLHSTTQYEVRHGMKLYRVRIPNSHDGHPNVGDKLKVRGYEELSLLTSGDMGLYISPKRIKWEVLSQGFLSKRQAQLRGGPPSYQGESTTPVQEGFSPSPSVSKNHPTYKKAMKLMKGKGDRSFVRLWQDWDAKFDLWHLLPGGMGGASQEDMASALVQSGATPEQLDEALFRGSNRRRRGTIDHSGKDPVAVRKKLVKHLEKKAKQWEDWFEEEPVGADGLRNNADMDAKRYRELIGLLKSGRILDDEMLDISAGYTLESVELGEAKTYQVKFGSLDHELLAQVSGGKSDPLRALTSRTTSRRSTNATKEEILAAIEALRKHGDGPEYEDFADTLEELLSESSESLDEENQTCSWFDCSQPAKYRIEGLDGYWCGSHSLHLNPKLKRIRLESLDLDEASFKLKALPLDPGWGDYDTPTWEVQVNGKRIGHVSQTMKDEPKQGFTSYTGKNPSGGFATGTTWTSRVLKTKEQAAQALVSHYPKFLKELAQLEETSEVT